MGQLERVSRKRSQKKNLQKLILSTISTVGLLGVAMVAPAVFNSMAKMGLSPGKRQGESVNASRDRLIIQGLLKYEGKFLQLTKKGESALRRFEFADFKLKKPRRWDGKWRVLIFDIPERRKKIREQIRLTLVQIGFIHLQDSVWVYPYDCEDLVTLLKSDFKIGKELLYMIVDTLEHDVSLKKYFNLLNS